MDEESNERVQQYLLDNDMEEAWLGLIQSMDGVLSILVNQPSLSIGRVFSTTYQKFCDAKFLTF